MRNSKKHSQILLTTDTLVKCVMLYNWNMISGNFQRCNPMHTEESKSKS